jgi:hypothetical protein
MRSASLLVIKIWPLVQKSLKATELHELKPLDLRRQKQDNQSAIKYEYDMDRRTNNLECSRTLRRYRGSDNRAALQDRSNS